MERQHKQMALMLNSVLVKLGTANQASIVVLGSKLTDAKNKLKRAERVVATQCPDTGHSFKSPFAKYADKYVLWSVRRNGKQH